jgi:predicted secreted protein
LIIVPATGTVIRANDEAHATFMIEEQDKDKAAAASRVNQKIKQGIEILKREDPQARLKTRGYYTYAVYADEQQPPRPLKARQLVGWRVGQYVEATTANLAALPRTVAAAQSILGLNGLRFGLSEKTARSADDELIAAAYGSLTERIASIARALGRSLSEAAIDTVDYEGSGNYAQQPQARMAMAPAGGMAGAAAQVQEPSFEPGETTLTMRIVGRVKFK